MGSPFSDRREVSMAVGQLRRAMRDVQDALRQVGRLELELRHERTRLERAEQEVGNAHRALSALERDMAQREGPPDFGPRREDD